jgi:hypothetical protein
VLAERSKIAAVLGGPEKQGWTSKRQSELGQILPSQHPATTPGRLSAFHFSFQSLSSIRCVTSARGLLGGSNLALAHRLRFRVRSGRHTHAAAGQRLWPPPQVAQAAAAAAAAAAATLPSNSTLMVDKQQRRSDTMTPPSPPSPLARPLGLKLPEEGQHEVVALACKGTT